jgi:hypothetical protein
MSSIAFLFSATGFFAALAKKHEEKGIVGKETV